MASNEVSMLGLLSVLICPRIVISISSLLDTKMQFAGDHIRLLNDNQLRLGTERIRKLKN
jgi:hypothetical protein